MTRSIGLLASGVVLCGCVHSRNESYPLSDGGTVSSTDEAGGGVALDADFRSDTAPATCHFSDSSDHDGDGYSHDDGDCNDCDPNANPGAYDVANNQRDEDCNGKADDEPGECDANVLLDSTDATDAAKSMGICRRTSRTAVGKARTWGVVAAEILLPDGASPLANPPGHGCAPFEHGYGHLSHLGINAPREGKRMFALSSGTARDPTDPGYVTVVGCDKGYVSGTPAPYPRETAACPGVVTGRAHDGVALRLTIRVPTNARSFSLNESFFSVEFPQFVCSTFNDSFVITMAPNPNMNSNDANVAFDQQDNPISVNNSLLQVCDPQTTGGKSFPCPQGAASLSGTGFGPDMFSAKSHAATGWLKTTVSVEKYRGKEITLFIAIWDSGDGVLDSTAILDNFQWSADPATGAVTRPDPK